MRKIFFNHVSKRAHQVTHQLNETCESALYLHSQLGARGLQLSNGVSPQSLTIPFSDHGPEEAVELF